MVSPLAWAKRNSVLLWVAAVAIAFFLAVPPVQFVNALTLGAIYALIALGYTMVYGIVELINFAHGDVFMLGTFVCNGGYRPNHKSPPVNRCLDLHPGSDNGPNGRCWIPD